MIFVVLTYMFLVFCSGCQVVTAMFDSSERILAQVSVGVFLCCVIGFLFSVLSGCFLQCYRLAVKAGKVTQNSLPPATTGPASISKSMALHTDGKRSTIVRLDTMENTATRQEKSRDMDKNGEANSRDIRESLYASIDVNKKNPSFGIGSERYPPIDYR